MTAADQDAAYVEFDRVSKSFDGQTLVVHDVDLAQVRAQVDTGNVYWDVLDMEIADAVRACDEGLLEPIGTDLLAPAPDGTPAVNDFLPDTQTECGVGTIFSSGIYAYNAELLSGERPETMADFFDLEKFPGRRGLRRAPQVNLEWALIADGVPIDDVYAMLDTPAGIDRAFAKLDTIKDDVVWWEAGAQPPQMLADGEVVMSGAFNGRIFNAQVSEGQPFVIVWDGQVLDVGQMGIVAGTPNYDAALAFVRFATTARSMSRLGRYISYSPTRRSAAPLVTSHFDTGVEMYPHMPATPEHLKRALWLAARLSRGAPDRACAVAARQPAAGAGAGAVLDVAAGAHHRLDRAASAAGRAERPAGGDRSRPGRRTARHGLQHDRHRGGDDACPAAVHGAAAVCGHARDPAAADVGRGVARRRTVAGVPARLLAADVAGRRRRIAARLHPGDRLLHHPRAGGGAERAVDLQPDRPGGRRTMTINHVTITCIITKAKEAPHGQLRREADSAD